MTVGGSHVRGMVGRSGHVWAFSQDASLKETKTGEVVGMVNGIFFPVFITPASGQWRAVPESKPSRTREMEATSTGKGAGRLLEVPRCWGRRR